MPKILAPTLSAHRDLRRSALIDAAVDLARVGGGAAITMGAVAERAGLSRSAVYEYFRSSADLAADVILDELAIWANELSNAVANAEGESEQIESWVRAALEYVADGRHALARALSDVSLPADRRGEVNAMHRLLVEPLVEPLTVLHGEQAERLALFINGIVEATTRRIERGCDADSEINAALAFIRSGISPAE